MSITYQVTYYGLLAERRGLSDERVTSTAVTPVALFEELLATHSPGLSAAAIRVAVNDEFVPWDHMLTPNDRIAFLPPMSGG